MLKDGITEIIQKYDIDAGVIVKHGDQIMYQHQAEKIFPAGSLIDLAMLHILKISGKRPLKLWMKKWKLLIFLVCVALVLLVIYVVLIGAFET